MSQTVDQYLENLPEDRRATINKVREVILGHLPKGYEETIQYGMISYVVPHSLYPAGYHCDPKQALCYAMLGSQKNYISLYLMTVYGDPETAKWFKDAFSQSGKKLDMGKSCVRFKTADDLPLDVIGEVIARTPVENYIAATERALKR